MITSDKVRELVDRIYVHTDWETKEKLLDYISQQEKITELLGLYEEKNLLIEVLYVGVGNDQINKYQMKGKSENYKRLEEILIKIEQLKKELGEMK